jgi:hypothetical protein
MARGFSGIRIYDVFNRETLDRSVYVLVFLFGAAGIILLKVLAVSPYLVALFSAGMILLYVIFTLFSGRTQIEPEMVGDNCYYLGFLFTLTSLAFTLTELAGAEDAVSRTDMIGKVISGFGVALSSTIMGVFLRVVLMQVRPDIVARDREMHIELYDSVREFRRQLAQSLLQMKNFSIEAAQLADERDARWRASFEERIENAKNEEAQRQEQRQAALDETLSMVHAELEAKKKQLETEIALLRSNLDERVTEINKHSSEVSERANRSVKDLFKTIETAQSDALKSTVEAVAKKVEATAEEAGNSLQTSLTRLIDLTGKIVSQAEKDRTAAAETVQAFADAISGVRNNLDTLGTDLQNVSSVVKPDGLKSALAEFERVLGNTSAAVESSTSKLRSDTEVLGDQVSEAAKAVRDMVSEIEAARVARSRSFLGFRRL